MTTPTHPTPPPTTPAPSAPAPAPAKPAPAAPARPKLKSTDTANILFMAKGNDGSDTSEQFSARVTWESGDERVLKLNPSSDMMSAKMHPQGLAGHVKVKATGLDVHGRSYVAECEIEIEGAETTKTVELVMGDSETPNTREVALKVDGAKKDAAHPVK